MARSNISCVLDNFNPVEFSEFSEFSENIQIGLSSSPQSMVEKYPKPKRSGVVG